MVLNLDRRGSPHIQKKKNKAETYQHSHFHTSPCDVDCDTSSERAAFRRPKRIFTESFDRRGSYSYIIIFIITSWSYGGKNIGKITFTDS